MAAMPSITFRLVALDAQQRPIADCYHLNADDREKPILGIRTDHPWGPDHDFRGLETMTAHTIVIIPRDAEFVRLEPMDEVGAEKGGA